jgi:hypothetical protein
MNDGPYYADYDEDTALWCVFNVDDAEVHAYSSWACQWTADEDAKMRNENLKWQTALS